MLVEFLICYLSLTLSLSLSLSLSFCARVFSLNYFSQNIDNSSQRSSALLLLLFVTKINIKILNIYCVLTVKKQINFNIIFDNYSLVIPPQKSIKLRVILLSVRIATSSLISMKLGSFDKFLCKMKESGRKKFGTANIPTK